MAIDEQQIIRALSSLAIEGNEEGLIPAFGLYLTKHLADYYNRISFATLRRLERNPELVEDGRYLLTEAGHVCAFNTFGGIMKSTEWEAIVRPMVQTTEDWLHGMVAIVNCFGWGRWSVVELQPLERLVVRVTDSYEAAGWLRDYPPSKHARCFLACGGVAGLMNLLYVGGITEAPELTNAVYRRLFCDEDSFVCRETQCVAKGDPICEFVAVRGSRFLQS